MPRASVRLTRMQDEPRVEASRWLPAGTFDGEIALVTGGGTGLGLELTRGLASLGAHVIVASRNPANHASVLEEARERGWNVEALALDVREPVAVERAALELVQRLGRVDILVNNAAGNFLCPAERLSARAWRSVLGIVLDGTFYCSRYVGRSMIEAGRGRILNIVATYAWTGMPGVVHSASAKAGVLAMTKTLAAEWARHGIRVNAVAPGPFHSDGAAERLWPEPGMRERLEAQIPLQRLATATEVAAHCLYLLSPAAEYITGECLVVDGGLSLGRNMWAPGETRRARATE
ncbi:MAG TPA: SDR family oxidoreductase [Planctomycetota bacterium]|nr:SDR family oxidoreductase [Planctomycetota bacterium]